MGRIIMYDSQGRDITCMKEYGALKYPCRECDRTDCGGKEKTIVERRINKCTYMKVIWEAYIHQMTR